MTILDASKGYQKYFEEITKIPHGSAEEKQISDYLVQVAHDHNLKVVQDESNNVIIYKNASLGYEDHPAVVLQAHIDMVNEKNSSSNHDFSKDPLDLYIEDGFLKAHGTTLGADDGAGVAYILSVLTDPSLKHPHLIGLFTVNEEATMEGAFNLDMSLINAKRMINIDGEEEDASTTGSAGGMDIVIHHPITYIHAPAKGYALSIKGLLGGHSGGEIHKERGNSNKIIARLLHQCILKGDVQLESLKGGLKINAIPREADATFTSSLPESEVLDIINKTAIQIKKELEFTDEGLTITIEPCNINKVLDKDVSKKIIDFLYLVPTGLRHKSDHLNGLTTSSENIGIIDLQDETFEFGLSVRGALDSYVQDLADEIQTLAKVFGFSATTENWYPAWDYMEHSPMRDLMAKVYKETHDGKEIQMYAVHGGLECGIFKEKCPDMDIVAIGPNIYDVHTPDEKLDLKSFDRTYSFLCKYLENL
ncbi:beta-Ala-His dipeptidase [Anaerorhabdus sp.]|uniref:beta-Ala-His dipeptidase n=1 Tax=Anaerorhabdus sp. TaxID=1872524 RepID=UPI002FC7AE12